MNTLITKSYNANPIRTQFTTDSLHQYYDFEQDKVGDTIFDRELIYKLYSKEITGAKELKQAMKLVEFIKQFEKNPIASFNFIISLKDGKIIKQVGYRCGHIKDNLDEYVEYLDYLRREGIETRIEFEEESEEQIEEYEEY